VQRVLQNLLDEGVNIRDMRTIIENARRERTAHAGPARTHVARGARRSAARFCRACIPPAIAEIQVMTHEPALERILMQAMAGAGDGGAIEPSLADGLLRHNRRKSHSARRTSASAGAARAAATALAAVALPAPARCPR